MQGVEVLGQAGQRPDHLGLPRNRLVRRLLAHGEGWVLMQHPPAGRWQHRVEPHLDVAAWRRLPALRPARVRGRARPPSSRPWMKPDHLGPPGPVLWVAPASHASGLLASIPLCQKPYLLAAGGFGDAGGIARLGQEEALLAAEQRHALPGACQRAM